MKREQVNTGAEPPSGGQANVHGVLVQTLIALFDALLDELPCEWLTLEPNLQSEKFDLLWKDRERLHAVQIKTSVNPFTRAFAERLAKEMKAKADQEVPGAECRLVLVGHPAEDLVRVKELNGVAIVLRSQTETDFIEQAAHRLHAFLDRQELGPVKAEFHRLLVGHLTTQLAGASAKGTQVQAAKVTADLKRWVTESPHYHPDTEVEDIAAKLATYFEHVIGRSDKLLLAGIDPKASDPRTCKRLDLANVYIELATDLRRPRREDEKTQPHNRAELTGLRGDADTSQVSALEATSDHRRLVLIGKPGSAKTTFVRYLCLCLAQQFRHAEAQWLDRLNRSGWADGFLVPIVVELRFFARSLAPDISIKPQPRALWDFFVQHSLEPNAMEHLQGTLLRVVEAGRALVIFEGLDEVPTNAPT